MKFKFKNSVSLVTMQVVLGLSAAQAMFGPAEDISAAVGGRPSSPLRPSATPEKKPQVLEVENGDTTPLVSVAVDTADVDGDSGISEPASPAKSKKKKGRKTESAAGTEASSKKEKKSKKSTPAAPAPASVVVPTGEESATPSLTRFKGGKDYKIEALSENEKTVYNAVVSAGFKKPTVEQAGDAQQLQKLNVAVNAENLKKAALVRLSSGKHVEKKEQLEAAVSHQAFQAAAEMTKDPKKKALFLKEALTVQSEQPATQKAVDQLLETVKKHAQDKPKKTKKTK